MPDEAPIVFRGPDHWPGDDEAAAKVIRFLRAVLVAGAEPGRALAGVESRAVLDGLISVWLDLSLRGVGVTRTEESLRLLRRDLPKMAAARRAADASPQPGEAGRE